MEILAKLDLILLLSNVGITVSQNFNWLSLATYGSSSVVSYQNALTPERQCTELAGLDPEQVKLCKQVPSSVHSIVYGAQDTVFQCQKQFKYERWNCTEKTPIDPKRPGFYDLLGNTMNAGNRETGFVAALSSAGIVFAIIKGCRAGNISDCRCDNTNHEQEFMDGDQDGEEIGVEAKIKYSWNGCSDNIKYALEFARKFFDVYEQKVFQETRNIRHLVNIHNYYVGREVVAQNMQKHCRCHGISGSCEYQTCWLETPDFDQIGKMLKDRYDRFSVQVAKKVKKRLRRKERSERKMPLRAHEIAYVNRSPNYCDKDDQKGILGTSGRHCNQTVLSPGSCNLLCCGRGYRSIEEERTEQCFCKFVYCCAVKCKKCLVKYVTQICK